VLRRKLPHEVMQQLKQLAQQQSATLFMALQSCFAALLGRWSNAEDVVMGTPVAGREQRELEPLVGFFVNTLVLRNDLSGNPSFAELLRRTRDMALMAFEHQHVPWEMLVEALVPGRSLQHAPLFQILFALQNYERSTLSLEGLELQRVEATVAARFDLTLITAEADDGLFTDWYYDTELFEAQTIERLADQYALLLSAVVAEPEAALLGLEIVSKAERQRLLGDFQHWQRFEYRQQHVLDEFVACAQRTPHATAVSDACSELSYGELQRRSNQLAHHLIECGVQEHGLVAVCAGAGVEVMVAIFAVLKCGAGYVPLDPKYPAERLNYVLQDSGAGTLLVDDAEHSAMLGWQGPLVDLASPAVQQQIERCPGDDIELERHARAGERPAYLIYTSGSTGKPKGTLIRQQPLVASLVARFASYPAPVRCSLLSSSISFDASITSIFWTLLSGGRLHICDDRERKDPAATAELIERLAVSHYVALPSFYSAVLDAFDGQPLTGQSLEIVVLAGEALPTEVQEKHFAHPSVRSALYNEYGPTECSVWSTLYRCEREPEPRPVPIGHSPGHARLYVLNPVRALVPIGVEGELYIGGDGVAEGYLHRPELSAERFLHDPLAEVPNARMYRSGDRVRWRKDGEIEFLGRMDHQVKLRGYRIELGEVETAVARYAGVAQAVVRIVDERLVAYVCGAAALAEPAAAQQIRSFVAERLPDYMVPQWVVVLDAMPLLPNGKVAVGQLPAAVPQAAVNQLKLPHTAREQELLALWREVLKAESISTDQDFFALGGDSILLLRLSAQLARRNLKFSVRDFYGQPTIEHMALLLQSTEARADADETISGAQLLHPIQRWFLEGDDTDLHHFNQSLLVHAPETLPLAILQQLLAAVYQRHDVLRLQFGREAAGCWQAAYRALDPALIESSCLQLDVGVEPGESLSDAVARTAQQVQESLSLQGPLLKVAHLRLPDGTARLLLVAHHLIVDGVSWRILLSDLQQAATQLLTGEPARLAAKSVSYQSVVRRLQEHAQTDAVLREVPYWQSVLAAPFDFDAAPSASCTVADEAQATLTLPVETTRALLQDCQRAYGMAVEEVLLSALSLAVWRWRGWRRTALILEGHGRSILPELDCADTVGWFTSQYPLVLEGCPEDLSAQLRATKQQLRGVPARGQHYGLLQSLATEQGLGADHAWHERGITFNYLGQFDASAGGTAHFAPAAERTGNNVSPRRARTGAIVFDGLVSNAQLRFSIRYTRGQFEAAAIQALATCYREALQELIAHWSQRDLTTPTRADFPLLQLEETELDEWQRRWPALLDAYPATPVQQGMIFHTLRDAGHGGSTYLSQVFMDIHGALDVPRFEAAWQHVLQQYEVFRTALVPLQRGGVAQVVLPSGAVRLPCVVTDISQHDVTEQRVQLERAAAADRAQPFDFAQPPLLRVALWKLDATHHRLLFTAHHAVIDGWSLPLVFNSLLQSYRQGATQAASAPSFKRYLEWLQVQDTTAAKAHWREQLVQLDAPCLIRPDLGPGEGATPGVATLLRRLDRAQVAQLTAAARAAGVTLYALVQAAWAYVLHTYTSLDTVVFGSVTSGRPATLPHAERMVGLFINTLPVAIAVEFEQSLQRWIQHIHRQQLSGQAFEYLPLAEILKVSPVGAAKLFNTVLVYQNYPLESAGTTDAATQAATDLRISNVYSDESTETDLALVVMPSKAGLTLKLLAQRQSLSEGFSERLLQQFERVLTLIPTCMTQPVAALDAAAPRTGAEDEDLELLALLSEAGATAELQLLTP
jgi:amino acid adenylation domain-containing protein/non-ribosomal peptide synthase protein (TIGR01720 family)